MITRQFEHLKIMALLVLLIFTAYKKKQAVFVTPLHLAGTKYPIYLPEQKACNWRRQLQVPASIRIREADDL